MMNPIDNSEDYLMIIRLEAQLSEYERLYELAPTSEKPFYQGQIAEIRVLIKKYRDRTKQKGIDVKKRTEKRNVIDKKLEGIDEKIENRFKELSELLRNERAQKRFMAGLPKRENHPNIKRYTELYRLLSTAKTTMERGARLEDFCVEIFKSFGDIFEVSHRDQGTKHHEIDIIVTVNDDKIKSEFGSWLIVECKNTKAKSNTGVVDKIISNIKKTRSKTGILFTMGGITSDAQHNIRETFLLEGIAIIVFNNDDIKRLAKGDNPIRRLWEKYYNIRLGIWRK